MKQINRDPGSCPKQHFIDNGCVAGMTVSFSENPRPFGVSVDHFQLSQEPLYSFFTNKN
ncbi:MAG TPA: hypothetical protein VK517_11680 [Cyclobacteriaceae bacterium]|nr:hypothetical protein [Cyclobacteriaceae bacterium]